MPELRTSENSQLSVHFGDFAESMGTISETAVAFTVHLNRSADAVRRLRAALSAMSSATKTLDIAKENIAHTNTFSRLLKKAHGILQRSDSLNSGA